MAAMSSTDRQKAARRLAKRMFEEKGATANFDLDTIRAAVNAADDWCDSNAAAFNLALPLAFRTNASATEKAELLAYVALRRAGVDG